MPETSEGRPVPNGETLPEHHFDRQLNRHGIPTTVSAELLEKLTVIPGERLDPVTGLPLETDGIRTAVTARLGEAMKSGENFACVYTDTDNLKRANGIHRDFGDAIIRSDVARVGAMIEDLDFSEAEIYLLRQTGAADETLIWFFGLNENQIASLREKTGELNRKRHEVTVTGAKGQSHEFVLSTTAAVIDSTEEEVQNRIQETLNWMRENEAEGISVIPRNDYREIKRTADDITKFLKVAKDIARLPVEELGIAESRKEVKEILVRTIANSRVSEPFARTVLTIMERTTVMDVLSQHESREAMCDELQLDPAEADRLDFSDEDLRVMYFDSLLHKTYEEAGIDTSDH